jgi:hypothetical protein
MFGVHRIEMNGKTYKAMGRFKENVRASSWQLLDRDVDQYTPAEFAVGYDEWFAQAERLLPGLGYAPRVRTLSSSARVFRDGSPLGAGNGHTWAQIMNIGDVERMRSALLVRAAELGLTWLKPRFSRREPTQVIGHSLVTIMDLSTWTPGRLVFNGKPTAAMGMMVVPQTVEATEGDRLNTSMLVLPEADRIRAITRAAGVEMRPRCGEAGSLVLDAYDLSLDTEIELENGTLTTLRDAVVSLKPGSKRRCQTPFRASTSMAAFLSIGGDGKPFVHDVGTNTTHWLNDDEAAVQGFSSLAEDTATSPEVRPTAVRQVILYTPEDLTKQSYEVERLIRASAADGEYLSFGGVLCDVRPREMPYTHLIDNPDHAPPAVAVLEPIDEVRMRELVERVAVFHKRTSQGINPIAVPDKIIQILIQKKAHSGPKVNGLLTHPIVLADGTILAQDGLHVHTGLFLQGAGLAGAIAYSQAEAHRALPRLRVVFLEGFAFESPFDAEVALSAVFTGVQRRILDQAPGYLFTAPQQSSGKTTLARRLHVLLTGHDLPVSSFPENDDAEMQKRLLAMLLRSPAMVCLDNITDGLTFRSSAMSAVMTSSVLIQRVLGISREAECPTNVLMVVTGNNISLGTDENTRWLTCRLNPKSARPHERTFTHPDVIAHALSIRESVLRDVGGIIAGYIKSGAAIPSASRFVCWDRFVRQALIWAGGEDVAKGFLQNLETSETVGAHLALLVALRDMYKEKEFSARGVANAHAVAFENDDIDMLDRLENALENLHAKDTRNARSVGRALNSVVGRIAETDEMELLRLDKRMKNGQALYRVIRQR